MLFVLIYATGCEAVGRRERHCTDKTSQHSLAWTFEVWIGDVGDERFVLSSDGSWLYQTYTREAFSLNQSHNPSQYRRSGKIQTASLLEQSYQLASSLVLNYESSMGNSPKQKIELRTNGNNPQFAMTGENLSVASKVMAHDASLRTMAQQAGNWKALEAIARRILSDSEG